MIVENSAQFEDVLEILCREKILAFDYETTGLHLWKNDRMFSCAFATEKETYYFDFKDKLPRELHQRFGPIFQNPDLLLFMHNAKFDMAAAYKEGLEIYCQIHDTEVAARLIYNDYFKYSLEECARRDLKVEKPMGILEWLNEQGLYTKTNIPDKKSQMKLYDFSLAPFELRSERAQGDARITYDLGIWQLNKIKEKLPRLPTLEKIYGLEKQLTRTCFAMEKRGIKINRKYCEEQIKKETNRYQSAARSFKETTKIDLINSSKVLAPLFQGLGYTLNKTKKGGLSVDDAFLENCPDPVAKIVQEYRAAYKRANTYYRAFLFYADSEDTIHANFKQSGTRTGRFSCKEPNLQNIPKPDEDGTLEEIELSREIRRAFIPRPGHFFVMIDYKQMEFRMMLDYAGQKDLIGKILEGHDPHQATADLTGLKRTPAKTLNFGILYGMGIDKLAGALKTSKDQASIFKKKYFAALPNVEDITLKAKSAANESGIIFDWIGRRFYFTDPKFSYKAINALIQGGCADVVKQAMVDLPEIPSLQIHDECLFELPFGEEYKIPQLQKVMEDAYKARYLPLTCSVSHSAISWGEPTDGPPGEDFAARNQIQEEGPRGFEKDPRYMVFKNPAAIH